MRSSVDRQFQVLSGCIMAMVSLLSLIYAFKQHHYMQRDRIKPFDIWDPARPRLFNRFLLRGFRFDEKTRAPSCRLYRSLKSDCNYRLTMTSHHQILIKSFGMLKTPHAIASGCDAVGVEKNAHDFYPMSWRHLSRQRHRGNDKRSRTKIYFRFFISFECHFRWEISFWMVQNAERMWEEINPWERTRTQPE